MLSALQIMFLHGLNQMSWSCLAHWSANQFLLPLEAPASGHIPCVHTGHQPLPAEMLQVL